MSETTSRREVEVTPEFQALEMRIEARMSSGEGGVPHPVTASERAAAMQEARERAFSHAAVLTYEPRRHTETPTLAQFTF